MEQSKKNKLIFASGLVLLAALSRLVPVIPNFSPVYALALFAGAVLGNRILAISVPVFAMLLSDLALEFFSDSLLGYHVTGFHSTMYAVYLSLIISVLIGELFIKNVRVLNIIFGALISSIVFFVLTNLAVWVEGVYYETTFAGLAKCFEMAIPFFRNTVASSLVFSAVLFGCYELAVKYVPAFKNS